MLSQAVDFIIAVAAWGIKMRAVTFCTQKSGWRMCTVSGQGFYTRPLLSTRDLSKGVAVQKLNEFCLLDTPLRHTRRSLSPSFQQQVEH
jgi:hypothetical protein